MDVVKIVADTSVITEGRISEVLEEYSGKEPVELIIPHVVLAELERQADSGREVGFDGLRELKSLHETKRGRNIRVSFSGEHPKTKDMASNNRSTIHQLVRKAAVENNALLVTADRLQALVAEANGIQVKYLEPKADKRKPAVLDFFDDTTMSLHLKEETAVYAKKGHVGSFELVKIHDKISREEMERYVQELVEFSQSDPQGYVEMEEKGATVIQLREYRIVVARPPFSDGLELTIVQPLVKTKLSDYSLSKKLLERLESHAEGLFVSGSPGAGKTTFVQALAEFYRGGGKIVKTMEHPRDLQVHEDITQYSPLGGSMEKTSDVLLLVRPDYTIFDEMRKTDDFKVFADMRLAGVGLVGVCHASTAIDSIQRLVGRVELGVIPHVVDTVLFIKAGKIESVYELRMTVKVPYGMTESDLARPVVEVRDFESEKPVYEMYSYGEEVVVIPVSRPKGVRQDRSGSSSVGFSQTKKHLILRSREHRDQHVKVFVDGEYVLSGRVNGAGNLKLRKNTEQSSMLLQALKGGASVTLEE